MKKGLYIFPVIIGNEKEYSVYFPDLDVATSGIDAPAMSKNFSFSLTLQEALKEKLKTHK